MVLDYFRFLMIISLGTVDICFVCYCHRHVISKSGGKFGRLALHLEDFKNVRSNIIIHSEFSFN